MATKFRNTGACLVIIAGQRILPGEHGMIPDEHLEGVNGSGVVKSRILVKGDVIMPPPVVIPAPDTLSSDMSIAMASVKIESNMATLGRWLSQENGGAGRAEILDTLNARMSQLAPPPPPPVQADAITYSPDGKHYLDKASNTWKPVSQ